MAKKQTSVPRAATAQTTPADETERKIRNHWEIVRWGGGFKCPACGWMYTPEWATQKHLKPRKFSRYRSNLSAPPLPRARDNIVCPKCGTHVSATSRTLLGGAKKPPSIIFSAVAVFLQAVDGISAAKLKKAIGIGTVQTAQRYIHRFHQAMKPRPWDRLKGTVQIDEGKMPLSPLKGGRYSLPFIIGVEKMDTGATGRIGLRISKDPIGKTWYAEAAQMIEIGSTIETRRPATYGFLEEMGCASIKPVEGTGKLYGKDLLPLCATVNKRVMEFLKKNYRGSVKAKRAQAYLDEIAFRLNHPDLEAATKDLISRLLHGRGKTRRKNPICNDAMP